MTGSNLFSGPKSLVTIIADVEPNKQTFVIQKSLVSYHSPFFHAVFNSSFEEGRTQSMTLEDVESGVFDLLSIGCSYERLSRPRESW
jgi:hypothetical protein